MIYPPSLKFNDKVAIVAPAGSANQIAFENGMRVLKSWGLNPTIGKYAQGAYTSFYNFSGTDQERLADFQYAIDNPEIRAIICVRGGYGSSRIIDKLDFSPLKTNPKWIVGFSDITAFHCHLNRLKIASIHGISPNLFDLPNNQIAMNSLKNLLFGKQNKVEIPTHDFNRQGNSNAEIIGGNSAILGSVLGTNSDFDTTNKILFIEEIGETPYRFDRTLAQLKKVGKFANLAGLIVGDLEGLQSGESEYRKDLFNRIVLEKVQEYTYPVCFDFPIGHQAANFAILCGGNAELLIDSTRVLLNFEEQNKKDAKKV